MARATRPRAWLQVASRAFHYCFPTSRLLAAISVHGGPGAVVHALGPEAVRLGASHANVAGAGYAPISRLTGVGYEICVLGGLVAHALIIPASSIWLLLVDWPTPTSLCRVSPCATGSLGSELADKAATRHSGHPCSRQPVDESCDGMRGTRTPAKCNQRCAEARPAVQVGDGLTEQPQRGGTPAILYFRRDNDRYAIISFSNCQKRPPRRLLPYAARASPLSSAETSWI